MSDSASPDNRLSQDDWSTYWKKGTLTTFQGKFNENYDGAIKEFWHQVVLDSHESVQVVDLATGNGALAFLIAELLAQKTPAITAIDYANIQPKTDGEYSELSQFIEFKGLTAVEQTGLQAHTFDMAISQFGFEYSQFPDAITELNRILKTKNARFAAIMHHSDSVLLSYADESLKQIQLCSDSGLIDITAELLKRIDRAKQNNLNPNTDAQCDVLRNQFNALAQQLLTSADKFKERGHIEFFLKNLSANFRGDQLGKAPLTQKLASLDFITSESSAFRVRMSDLKSAALDSHTIAALCKDFERIGFNVETCEPLIYENNLFAWKFLAKR